MNTPYNEFRLRVNIRTGMDSIYSAWATREGLESWFLRKALIRDSTGRERVSHEFLQEDDVYEWYWYGYPDAVVEKGKVISANGQNTFAFTFSLGCPVTISLHQEYDEIIVELRESDLPTDEQTILKHYVGDSRGWIFYLTNLKSVLEGGLDLRNKNEEIKDVITS